MADQSYGLRFDIYERVHLSENVVGIDELEEIELFPKIQVIPGEEYASLRGHLLLSGLYRGEGSTQELEHWIPVEITIPLSRVGKLEEIAVEIENFDVDLLSARSLNITGVLSLQGIETSSLAVEPEEWKDRELVVAHEPALDLRGDVLGDPDHLSEPEAGLASAESRYTEHFRMWEQESLPELNDTDEQQSILTWNDQASPLYAQSVVEDKEPEAEALEELTARDPQAEGDEAESTEQARSSASEQQVWFKEAARPSVTVTEIDLDEPPGQFASAEREEEALPVSQEEELSFEEAAPVTANFDTEDDVLTAEAEHDAEIRPEPEEKKELKIALGSKKNGDIPQESNYGISKLLSSYRPDSESGQSLQETEEVLPAAVQNDAEEVRWKSLFIRNAEDQTPFRKVRLVIVQREETLDAIAERYQLSSRELQLYNRLAEQHLSEGQVLYIP